MFHRSRFTVRVVVLCQLRTEPFRVGTMSREVDLRCVLSCCVNRVLSLFVWERCHVLSCPLDLDAFDSLLYAVRQII